MMSRSVSASLAEGAARLGLNVIEAPDGRILVSLPALPTILAFANEDTALRAVRRPGLWAAMSNPHTLLRALLDLRDAAGAPLAVRVTSVTDAGAETGRASDPRHALLPRPARPTRPANPAAPAREASLQERVLTYLASHGPAIWVMKVHGGRYQRAGIPDVIACIYGRFVGIELKKVGEPPFSPSQALEARAIQEAGGTCVSCSSLAEVEGLVSGILRESR